MISRGRDRKKYAVDRLRGPLILAAELLQKRLIQHCWPCAYEDEQSMRGHIVTFVAARGRQIGPDFDEALAIAVRVLSSETGARIALNHREVWLEGPHYIGSDGYPKSGIPKRLSKWER